MNAGGRRSSPGSPGSRLRDQGRARGLQSAPGCAGEPRSPPGFPGERAGNHAHAGDRRLSQLIPAHPSSSQLIPAYPSLSQPIPAYPRIRVFIPGAGASIVARVACRRLSLAFDFGFGALALRALPQRWGWGMGVLDGGEEGERGSSRSRVCARGLRAVCGCGVWLSGRRTLTLTLS